ncbi:MAG: PKD domain-containing protein [Flavobacteriales bacterium]|nr:MAG: PKD domain-containing protein [Flavobacteriales bacterium]
MNSLTKSIFLASALLLVSNINKAQSSTNNPCYFDEYTNNNSILQTEAAIQAKVEILKKLPVNKAGHDSSKTIPVVIHVLHIGGAENISDAQIQSQITIMNEDYGKIAGTNGDGNGVDTKIRFCLARIDPNGNCTNGIVRIYSTLTNHKTYERAMLKQLSFWDNTKYMNIYLVKSITGGVLGYSSFPGGPPDEDGMVVRSNVFGNIGTAASSLGRTASHEIGHWFGLYHTFNNGCGVDLCLDGDYICDTPPQATPSFNCNTLNTCSNDVPDVNDQKENYMSYTPGSCKDMFTNGQKLRIQATLDTIRTIIWSQTNLIATGCDSNYTAPTVCGVVANFVTLTPVVCEGNTVNFMDISLNDATSWQWTFPGGTPATSIVENPSITYPTLGSYDVTLVVSDGSTIDSITIPNYIVVSTPGVGTALPFSENFDSGIFPPQGIIINNFDGGVTWGLDSAASVSGNYSIKIDNYINTNYGSSDEIVLPYLDFTSFTGTNMFMTFKWAYARSDPSFSDEMIVLLSTDCGTNFNQIYYRTGNTLVTGPTQTTPFIPDSTQWATATILLNPYLSEQYVQVKIVNITDGGNNLYIDDINIGITTGIEMLEEEVQFTVYPNPASDNIVIDFTKFSADKTISIYNSIGKLVLSKMISAKGKHTILVNHFSSGIYYLVLEGSGTLNTQKIIISK